jgi:alpha-L-fucosidase
MKISGVLLILVLTCSTVCAQKITGGGEANPDLRTNALSLQKWREMRFGMFIHWGPVALRGTEIGWSRGREVGYEEYDNLFREFNPVLFDADEWVSIAKDAGMKYLILVTKHHDGFSLWDSEATEYDIMAGPYRRDIVQELSDACQRQGLLFGTYYSILDWYHPDYPIMFDNDVRKPEADMTRYIAFLKSQVKELITEYDSQILWFDGDWESPWTHEMGMDLYAWVRALNDNILINNRVDKGRDGMAGVNKSGRFAGDFETPEQRIGNYNPDTPWETCMTIGQQWAWKANDKIKTAEECLHTLVRTAGGDGNLLLNVGPMPDGRIEQRQIDRLREIGLWLQKYGDTIYGTRGGPVKPMHWGVTTQKHNRVFIHILNHESDFILLPGWNPAVKTAVLFADKSGVRLQQTDMGLVLQIPASFKSEPDIVIELTIKK